MKDNSNRCGNGSPPADIARRCPDVGVLSGTDVAGSEIGAIAAANATAQDRPWGQTAES